MIYESLQEKQVKCLIINIIFIYQQLKVNKYV